MIDIHTHIIPGIDDGAQDLTEAVKMAQAAVAEGIHTLIATPHHANGKYDNPMGQVKQAVFELNGVLREKGIPLTVLPGQEIRVYSHLLEDLDSKIAGTLHSTHYILIEFPTREIPKKIEALLHELRVMGLIPIIAHPERNMELASDPSKLQRLIHQGALAQITSHSINGLFGKKIQKLSFELFEHRMAHFVSSDAHNMKNRPFGLKQAYSMLAGKFGDDLVRSCQENAVKLVNNEEIPISQPMWKTKTWWKFWS